jgi:acyl-[acyl carrier protein]--UDP-N-acetylglucosamine O-acyltransferase
MGTNIHCTAIVNPLAKIADNAEIGPFSIIHANVELASGCRIGAYCELGIESPLSNGTPLIIEKDSVIPFFMSLLVLGKSSSQGIG